MLGFRFGAAAYLTDHSEIPEESKAKLHGLDVLFLDALRHRPHPTPFDRRAQRRVGAKSCSRGALISRTSATICRMQETEAALPENVHLAYDGLELETGATAECESRATLSRPRIRAVGGDHREFRRRARRSSASVRRSGGGRAGARAAADGADVRSASGVAWLRRIARRGCSRRLEERVAPDGRTGNRAGADSAVHTRSRPAESGGIYRAHGDGRKRWARRWFWSATISASGTNRAGDTHAADRARESRTDSRRASWAR